MSEEEVALTRWVNICSTLTIEAPEHYGGYFSIFIAEFEQLFGHCKVNQLYIGLLRLSFACFLKYSACPEMFHISFLH